VLGAFIVAVKRNINKKIHAFLCIAENSVGPLSTRPDDVHKFLSGKTVEINNTDAEGRLVLADGCHYAASRFNPSLIMDMATLTGAQGVTTGQKHAAIYCTDDDLEALAMKVGKYTGDLTMPIVYCPEFHRAEFKSQVCRSSDVSSTICDTNLWLDRSLI
jgi:probable aminopeptidase NPEPL1